MDPITAAIRRAFNEDQLLVSLKTDPLSVREKAKIQLIDTINQETLSRLPPVVTTFSFDRVRIPTHQAIIQLFGERKNNKISRDEILRYYLEEEEAIPVTLTTSIVRRESLLAKGIKIGSIVSKSYSKGRSIATEYAVGFYGINRVAAVIPNFIWTYGYWNEKLMMEGIFDSIDNRTYIENATNDEICLLLYQILLSLLVAREHVGFSHNDLHIANVLLKELDEPREIEYRWGTHCVKLAVKVLAVIIDYGQSRVSLPEGILSFHENIYETNNYEVSNIGQDFYRYYMLVMYISSRARKSYFQPIYDCFTGGNYPVSSACEQQKSHYYLHQGNVSEDVITNILTFLQQRIALLEPVAYDQPQLLLSSKITPIDWYEESIEIEKDNLFLTVKNASVISERLDEIISVPSTRHRLKILYTCIREFYLAHENIVGFSSKLKVIDQLLEIVS